MFLSLTDNKAVANDSACLFFFRKADLLLHLRPIFPISKLDMLMATLIEANKWVIIFYPFSYFES